LIPPFPAKLAVIPIIVHIEYFEKISETLVQNGSDQYRVMNNDRQLNFIDSV